MLSELLLLPEKSLKIFFLKFANMGLYELSQIQKELELISFNGCFRSPA